MTEKDTSVKVAVRIRPLNDYEAVQDSSLCIDVVPGETQVSIKYTTTQEDDSASFAFIRILKIKY